MKRSDLISELNELQAESANVRGWLNSIDVRIAALKERLAAPAEQPAQTERPAQDFNVQPGDGRDAPDLSVQFDGDPVAPSINTLVTPKQLGMIKAIAREAGVDYELECQEQLGCKPEDLGKRAASAFIEYLQKLRDGGAEFRKAG